MQVPFASPLKTSRRPWPARKAARHRVEMSQACAARVERITRIIRDSRILGLDRFHRARQFRRQAAFGLGLAQDHIQYCRTSAGGASNPADISFVGHQKQMADLIRAIETGDEPLINGEEGRKSVEIVRAIYESARTGTRVKLPISL